MRSEGKCGDSWTVRLELGNHPLKNFSITTSKFGNADGGVLDVERSFI